MSFFDTGPQQPAAPEPEFRYPEPGPWAQPPDLTLPGIITMNQILARTDDGVIALIEARAYQPGCWFDLVAAVRDPDTYGARRRIWNTMHETPPDSGELPPELLRFGVLYNDGTSATTLRRTTPFIQEGVPAPEPPVLHHRPLRGGESGRGWVELRMALWLWPLPPAEDFDLVLEYPLIGVPETRVRIDGSAITAAAATSSPLIQNGDTV